MYSADEIITIWNDRFKSKSEPHKLQIIMDLLKEMYTHNELADILEEKFSDVLEGKKLGLL